MAAKQAPKTFLMATYEGAKKCRYHHSFELNGRTYVVHYFKSPHLVKYYTASHLETGYRVGGCSRNPKEAEMQAREFLAEQPEKLIRAKIKKAMRERKQNA